MSRLSARKTADSDFGYFQIKATTIAGNSTDITTFRDIPTNIVEMSTRDPFGDASCSLSLPQITVFDSPGVGDLFWLRPYTNIDIRWVPPEGRKKKVGSSDDEGPDFSQIEATSNETTKGIRDLIDQSFSIGNLIPGLFDYNQNIWNVYQTMLEENLIQPPQGYTDYDALKDADLAEIIEAYENNTSTPYIELFNLYRFPAKNWKWEGFIASYDVSSNSGGSELTIQCKGALYQLDNYLSKPEHPSSPIPYETLIKRSFNPETHPGLATRKLEIAFPKGWSKKASKAIDEKPSYLAPVGVNPGEKWSGLTSRSTGAWDNTLTGFVQGLLSVMFTPEGKQWTIYKLPGRKPLLTVRRQPEAPKKANLHINAESPGVDISISRDFTQSVNLIYGQGKDFAGVSYSGQSVTPNGKTTYDPFAYSPQVYPPTKSNDRYAPKIAVPKEGLIQFPQGLSEVDAKEVAEQQYRRFADPGYTGTITLQTDPKAEDSVFSRFLIQAGMSIVVYNLLGNPWVVFHIVEANVNISSGTVTLSVDSKFRDHLTWGEVRARTRDALIPLRTLQVGQYSLILQDVLLPWSTRAGSGIIPSGKPWSAVRFFNDILPSDAKFPYEKWTKKYPPKNHRYWYIKARKRTWNNADENWAVTASETAFPVTAAQAANIRLTEIAAYDKHGNVKKVKFHVSFYLNRGTNVKSMPRIYKLDSGKTAKLLDDRGYEVGQHYPFFKDAWETVRSDGGTIQPNQQTTSEASLQVGWGNYFEPAGYSPGLYSKGGEKTGQLRDETPWSFDTTNQANKEWDHYNPEENRKKQRDGIIGMLYVMIFCDDDPDEDTYFMGRIFREEPGTS